MIASSSPVVRSIRANGIDYRVLEWSPTEWSATALLVHGYMDAGSTWDLVAPRLVQAGLRVLAPDLRGFGHGGRAPEPSYYHFPDYIFDVADLVDTCLGATPLFLVGHSMGGTVASLYAGSFPERVTKLALLEGVGPPDNPVEVAPVRMRRWIDEVRAVRGKGASPRSIGTREAALRRLAANHTGVDVEILRHRLPHLVRDMEGGEVTWANDPLHKTVSPMPFFAATYKAFAKCVTCPVLHVGGGDTGYHPPDEAERLAAFANLTRVDIADAGHMMHWTRPDVLADHLTRFWSRATT